MAFDVNTLLSAELHSIKNQMQALLSAQSDLAEALSTEPKFKEQIKQVQKSGFALSHNVIELLSILKIQNEAFEPNIDEHWFCDTVALVIQDLGALGQDVKINMAFDPDLNAFYDEQLISIAIHNCIVNAIKAGATAIDIDVEELPHGSLNIMVKDNGKGFAAERLEKGHFNPQGASSGLGLYLMEQALAVHTRSISGQQIVGGVKVDNQKQGGAVITLFLP